MKHIKEKALRSPSSLQTLFRGISCILSTTSYSCRHKPPVKTLETISGDSNLNVFIRLGKDGKPFLEIFLSRNSTVKPHHVLKDHSVVKSVTVELDFTGKSVKLLGAHFSSFKGSRSALRDLP